jgi:hypothetical protein
MFMIYS